eukprot:TRINITY_DN38949_c0_g1_i1.p2 TRINITY_DN38949_c0_g1~~TRINITY_DN38949_c0_g1_i1.p2  ORF type:complete len:240 (+),score=34.52 TRINITY_DN38949_c0_g1_i1:513-1232(+)
MRCPTCKARYKGDVLLLLAVSQAISMRLEIPTTVAARLASALESRGLRREARIIRDQEQRRNWWIAEPDHPDTLSGLLALAEALKELKQWEPAATLLRRTLKGADHRLPPDLEYIFSSERGIDLPELARERSQLAVDAAECLAAVLAAQGRHEDAAEMRGRARGMELRGSREVARCELVEAFGDDFVGFDFVLACCEGANRMCWHFNISIGALVIAVLGVLFLCVCFCFEKALSVSGYW